MAKSKIEVMDFEQCSSEWYQARLGIPTASRFKDILAKGEGKTRNKYLYQLAGELATGQPTEEYTNVHMERGKAMEGEARDAYAFRRGVELKQVGFIRNGNKGCSPDSLIGKDGILEIKTKLPYLMMHIIATEEIPPEHIPQVQGQLWITEREYVDLVFYWPNMKPVIKRVVRSIPYIKNLAKEVDRFHEDLQKVVERYHSYEAS